MSNSRNGRRYNGAVGRTREARTTVWCGECGSWYAARYQASIDADAGRALADRFLADGFAGVNTARCSECAAEYVVEEPLLFHRPSEGKMVLVLPQTRRHRARQHLAELTIALAEDPGDGLPPYALDPQLAVGHGELAKALRVAAPSGSSAAPPPPARPAEPPRPHTSATPLPLEDDRPPPPPLRPPSASTTPMPSASDDSIPPPVDEPPPAPDEADAGPEVLASTPPERGGAVTEDQARNRGSGLLDILGRREQTPPPAAPSPGDSWSSDIDDGWVLDGEGSPQDSQEHEPTQVVHADDIKPRERREAAQPPSPPAPDDGPASVEVSEDAFVASAAPDADEGDDGDDGDDGTRVVTGVPTFDEAKAESNGGYLQLRGGRVVAAVRTDGARAARFAGAAVGLRFQMHRTDHGPVLSIVLMQGQGDAGTETFPWVLRPEAPEHAAVLDALQERFEVEVEVYEEGGLAGRQIFQMPLEGNVRDARAAAQEAEAAPGSDCDLEKARAVVLAPDFDRLGHLRHNFTQDSFADAHTASQVRLALGILSYWASAERRDYLLFVQAFPAAWLDGLIRRVLGAALEFGLAMEPHMRQRALDLGLAEDSAALVRLSLANFAEVSLNLKPNDLDALDAWDNWEALLAHAEELEVSVDEEIEELAALAMDRAREAAQAAEPMEINADEESVDFHEVVDLGELTSADLVGLLGERSQRADAANALIQKGDAVFVAPIFEAVKHMGRPELLRVVPAALSMGPAFESHLLGALQSRKTGLRLASALFLAEIRSERAAGPLLELLPSATAAQWPVIARAAARLGRRIISHAVDLVRREGGDPEDRIARTLAMLGPEARGALSAAQGRAKKGEPAAKCIEQALQWVGEASLGDAADFTERLADAFDTAGPDDVAPDFEEDLESIDIGPAASIEHDVDLDGLDAPRRK
jgi:hypothetical protein